jgi:hypothetical protein
MSKAEEKSLKAYPQKIEWVGNQWDGAPFDVNSERRVAYKQGYEQAEKDLIDKTLVFLKKRLYKDGYVGIIDLCDDYIKAMKDE